MLVTGRRPLTVLLDVLLAALCAVNVVVLAAALVGFGPGSMLRWLPHLPAEFAALALALGLYLTARRRPVTLRQIAAVTAASLTLMALAAGLETYATPQARHGASTSITGTPSS